jgi:hypothetical protein
VWSFDIDEGVEKGEKRGDNINLGGDKSQEMQSIAEHLLKERLMTRGPANLIFDGFGLIT